MSHDVRLEAPPYDYAAAERLAAALGLSHPVAQVLVRRGLGDEEAAGRFLAADARHPLDAFGGLRAGARLIAERAGRGDRITVHGDYDVDGVCSTAVLVRALRTLGADVDWYLPSRQDDGYGLARGTVERLAARGTDLLVTVDCGITAVDEVAAARAAGMAVVVTDHHSPRADGRLPDAPIVHPRLGDYSCPELCAAGVAYKLAQALLEQAGLDPAAADADLDLVALATVADVVPLVDENRRLVRAGLRALASTRKPGLQALMEVARVDPSGVDAGAIGFRLAPRINAAGRLHRADAGLELLLTIDVARAGAIAAELDAVNAERREVETRILFEAEAQVAATGEAPAYVLAAEGWHPGVIGIVASRIAERHHRPAVLIALDGEEGTGSGRSIPAFDLLGGFDAAAADLRRHGGHRAAAGLTIARERVDAFRAAFTRHAGDVLQPSDFEPVQHVDAVVPGDALQLGLAEELERLAPFGMGNPEPTLLVPSALLADPRGMGEGRHVAFSLAAGGARSRCVSFGRGHSLPAAPGAPVDAAVRLEVNRYNGAVEPRLVLRHVRPPAPAPIEIVGEPPFDAALLRELDRPLDPWPPGPGDGQLVAAQPSVRPLDPWLPGPHDGHLVAAQPSGRCLDPWLPGPHGGQLVAAQPSGCSLDPWLPGPHDGQLVAALPPGRPSEFTASRHLAPCPTAPGGRTVRDARGSGIAGLLGDLVTSGEPVLVLCAHAEHRAAALGDRVGGFAVTTWAALEDDPALAAAYVHVVALDPPAYAHQRALPRDLPGRGWAHLAWGAAEVEFARRVHAWETDLRAPLGAVYRALRDAGRGGGETLEALLRGSGAPPRTGALAGRLLRVLCELGLVELERAPLRATVRAAPGRTELERSAAFRAYERRLREGSAHLADPEPSRPDRRSDEEVPLAA
jgi:single-stranded-DNA-specific exonuclease